MILIFLFVVDVLDFQNNVDTIFYFDLPHDLNFCRLCICEQNKDELQVAKKEPTALAKQTDRQKIWQM